ncbi:hypothetical protein EON81_21800 [bacterium]|nr:MAG: hypothetical protein EON81_21800 [bacterium]
MLETFSEDGKVLTLKAKTAFLDELRPFDPGKDTFLSYNEYVQREVGELDAKPEGVYEASTFKGFCRKHDLLFNPIDLDPFSWNLELCALHKYRALCADLWLTVVAERANMARNKLLSHSNSLEYMRTELRKAMQPMQSAKSRLEGMIQTKDYRGYRCVAWHASENPRFATAGAVAAPTGSKGVLPHIDGFNPIVLRSLVLDVLPIHKGCLIMFSWINPKPGNDRIMSYLKRLDQRGVLDFCFLFACNAIHNTFFAPTLWKSFSEEEREIIRTMSLNPERGDTFSRARSKDWFDIAVSNPKVIAI